MKAPWDFPVGRVSRKIAASDMELEVREMTLNQRLVQRYYERQHAELAGAINKLQRIDCEESRRGVA